MMNHRVSLGFVLLLGVAAGVIVGYAAFGLDDPAPTEQSQSGEMVTLLKAIATSNVPQAESHPTPDFIETLPLCDEAKDGTLCAPLLTNFHICVPTDYFYPITYLSPCYKGHKP